jgi:hypothetical protein
MRKRTTLVTICAGNERSVGRGVPTAVTAMATMTAMAMATQPKLMVATAT